MQNAEQDIKDDELNENVPADETTEPETADSARTVDHAHQEPDPGLPEPVAFEPDETPPQKPEPEDEFAPQPEPVPAQPAAKAGHPEGTETADQPDEDDEPDDTEPLEPEEYETTLETVIEAVLFASDEPLTPKRLVDIAEAGSVKQKIGRAHV